MSNRNLTILGFVAVGMIILAVAQSRRANILPKTAQGEPAYLIQGLNMDNVYSISSETTTDATVLKQIRGRFFITNKENYPANVANLNDLIKKVLDIQALEKITSNPENFAELGVDPNSARSVVKFIDQNEKLITGVIISNPAGSGQTYVRLLPTNDVYAANPVAWLPNAPLDFIEKQILDVQDNDIRSVTVSDPNGSYTLFYDPNNDKVTLDKAIPEGKQLKNSDAKSVIRALSSFRITDVMRAVSAGKNLKFEHSYLCRLNNTTEYTVKIDRQNNESFIKVKAEFKQEAKVYIDENETEEQLKKKEEQLLAGDAVLDFNDNHGSWIYKIAEYKADELTKKLDDLFEEMPQEEKEPETEGSVTSQQPQDPNTP